MGVLTDLVVADRENAEAIVNSINPAREWNGVDVKGIDVIKLTRLRSILVSKDYHDEWVNEFELLAGDETEGPWLFVVPHEITSALANLPKMQLENTAKQWYITEEFKFDNWSIQDVTAVLKEVHALAERAVSENKPILMWVCL